MAQDYEKVIDVINLSQSFLLASHAHPDGDGIGATLALGAALEKMGKVVTMYNENRVPRNLDFLPYSEKIVNSIDRKSSFDVSILIDCGQVERAGKEFPSKERRGILLCIDHHNLGQDNEAVCMCVDEMAASTGEVVYNILKRMNVEITPEIATNVLTTMIVDTGFFRYSNTSPHALLLASELVKAGASTWEVSRNMEERNQPQQTRLLSLFLDTIQYEGSGKVAISVLTGQMLNEAGASLEMAEEFVNFPRAIDGVEVAVLIREKNPSEYKISLRSKDYVNVSKIASEFGGGGHDHAAGCDVKGRLGDVRRTIVEAILKKI